MSDIRTKPSCFTVETMWQGEWKVRGEHMTKARAIDLELELVRQGELVRVFVVGKEIES